MMGDLTEDSIEEMFELSFKGQNDFDFVQGVHSKASNFAVFRELGQYPFVIFSHSE